ncbi:hypothetical protein Acsp01_20030 [Actinoplanes sp. NBRC 101535]|nr:hypothetical protein Acsp01_20030 [Actinoplanes sp. NBRC 101535]
MQATKTGQLPNPAVIESPRAAIDEGSEVVDRDGSGSPVGPGSAPAPSQARASAASNASASEVRCRYVILPAR